MVVSLSLSPVPKIRMLRMISSVHKTVLTLLLLVVFTLLLGNCGAQRNDEQCKNPPSPCRNILNISNPFRLKGDPENCGNKKYELYCEGNRTVVDLFPSAKYYVQAIDYKNYTIRLVDVGLQLGNCSSLPLYHLSHLNFIDTQEILPPYLLGNHKGSRNMFTYSTSSTSMYYYRIGIPWDIAATVLVDCEKPVTSPLYTSSTTASSCLKKLPTNKSNGSYSYVLFGSLRESNVADRCRIDEIVATTLWLPPAKKEGIADNSSSFSDFHSKLAYGFELSWLSILCVDCKGDCFVQEDYNVFCDKYCDVFQPNNYRRPSFRCRLERIFYKIVYQVYIHRQALINTGLFLGARYFCGILSLFAFLIYKFKRRHLSMFDAIEGFLQSQDNYLVPIRYSYFQIRQMTKGFKDKLGEGGFGSVYKGKLRSGHVAAIKVLEKSNANGQDFINEVATIGRIHHVNVVRLIGFCATRSKRALVYEYMPNGSLEKYLFSQEVNASLSCTQMHQICLGVARGIEYLHQGCDMQILHFDIKPHNILLDENFNPKVSDFGLAKLYPIDHSMVSMTVARGTMGYMAPELFYKNIGRVSYKADVYSYGMLLMEMAGRRRNLNAFADHTSQIYFPSWIYDQFKEGKEMEMEEACTEEEREMARKMVIVALWCIQMNPGDRPSMSKVVEMLEGNVEALEMPPKPFFTPQDMPTEDD